MATTIPRPNASSLTRADAWACAALLVAMYAAVAWFSLRLAYVGDADVWWHIRAGQWILQHHAVPRTDPFSSVRRGQPWVAYSWLFELLVVKLYQRWNLPGIVAYSTGALLAITAAFHHMVKRLQPDFTKVVALTSIAMISIWRSYTPRPWLLTILFFVLQLDILMHVRRTARARELLWLPPMYALWGNLHVQFVDGLVVLGLAAVESLLAPRSRGDDAGRVSARALWAVFAGALLALLLNPYGWKIYTTAYELASQSGVLSHVAELQALPFRGWADFILLFYAVGAAGVLGWRRRLPFFEAALLVFVILVSFRTRRDSWILVAGATAILAAGLPGGEEQRRRLPRPVAASAVLAVAAMVGLGARVLNVRPARLQSSLAGMMPVRAVDAIKQSDYPGPLFNDYAWGGYLIWALPQYPVSIDGRAALYGDALLDRSFATWHAAPDWASDPQLAAARLVLAPVKEPLTQVLRLSPRFVVAYEDKQAVVFVARPAGESALPAKPIDARTGRPDKKSR